MFDTVDDLCEYSTNAIAGCIGLQYERQLEVGRVEASVGAERGLECFECDGAAGGPIEWHVLACETIQRYANVCKSSDEIVIIIGQAEERTKLRQVGWHRIILHGANLGGIRFDHALADDVSDEQHLLVGKLALLDIRFESRSGEALEYGLDILLMLFDRTGSIHGTIVEECGARLAEHFAQAIVDVTLECGGRVAQSEWHANPFEMTARSDE